MKLATIRHQGEVTLVVRVGDGEAVKVVDVWQAHWGRAPATLLELVEQGEGAWQALGGALAGGVPASVTRIDVTHADWLAPHLRPSKVLGIAVNNRYLNRIAFRVPQHPMMFMKSSTALTGHEKPILLKREHGFAIPEPEIVAMISRTGKNIAEKDALEYIFGYTITNDITASGVKFDYDSVALDIGAAYLRPHHTAWREKFGDRDNYLYFTYHTRSKASDTFGPMGPWLTTRDEVPDPNALAVHSWVNGELYTEDSTANYLFSIQRCIAEVSQFLTLETGDLIHFGTAGAGTAKYPMGNRSVNLQDTDGPVDIEIEGLGRLSNPVQHV